MYGVLDKYGISELSVLQKSRDYSLVIKDFSFNTYWEVNRREVNFRTDVDMGGIGVRDEEGSLLTDGHDIQREEGEVVNRKMVVGEGHVVEKEDFLSE